MAICKLCNSEKNLIKKSHIYSEFLHSDLFDDKHKIFKVDTSTFGKSKYRPQLPTAIYEGGLMCKECDNELIGRFETYISNLIKKNTPEQRAFNVTKHPDKKHIKISNLDYQKTKSFILSLLWRANITSRPEFKDSSLGPYSE